MTIANQLKEKHISFTEYMKMLNKDEYFFRPEGKWNAAQQLQHIELCLTALMKAFYMPKEMLKEKFGLISRNGYSIDDLYDMYTLKLKEGGKSPDKFVPLENNETDREQLCTTLLNNVDALIKGIHNFTEDELDQYVIPHPLLGLISLREMLYNAIHHVQHHEKMTRMNLSTLNERNMNPAPGSK